MMLQTDVLEEAVFSPDTVLSVKDETVGYDSSRQDETEYCSLFGTEVNTGTSGRHNTLSGKMNSQPKMLPQQYCLRWKYHHNNLQVMFSQLLERESFCDVTLACEGKTLRAHKVSSDRTYASMLTSEVKGTKIDCPAVVCSLYKVLQEACS
jgi:hypothetical protein